MPLHTTIAAEPRHTSGAARALAIGAGTACAGITVANLLGGSAAEGITLEHVNLIALPLVTIAAGLLAKANTSAKRWGYALAFYTVFAAGTVMVIYNSVGSQAKTEAGAVAAVKGANASRADLISERDRLDAKIAGIRSELARFAGVRSAAEIKGALDGVVGTGPGKVPLAVWRRTSMCAATEITKDESASACQPVLALRVENGKAIEREALRRSLDGAEQDRAVIVAKIGEKREQPLPVKAKGFAEALAVLGADAAKVEKVMSRLDKVILALVLEFGAIIGLEFGLAGLFAGKPTKVPAPSPVATTPPSAGPPTTRKRGRRPDPKVIGFVQAYKAKHGHPPPAREIQSNCGVSRATAYRYVS